MHPNAVRNEQEREQEQEQRQGRGLGRMCSSLHHRRLQAPQHIIETEQGPLLLTMEAVHLLLLLASFQSCSPGQVMECGACVVELIYRVRSIDLTHSNNIESETLMCRTHQQGTIRLLR